MNLLPDCKLYSTEAIHSHIIDQLLIRFFIPSGVSPSQAFLCLDAPADTSSKAHLCISVVSPSCLLVLSKHSHHLPVSHRHRPPHPSVPSSPSLCSKSPSIPPRRLRRYHCERKRIEHAVRDLYSQYHSEDGKQTDDDERRYKNDPKS